jgi:hypothetical protein
MVDVVEAVAALLEESILFWTVYRHVVSDRPVPFYLVVCFIVGEVFSVNFVDGIDVRQSVVWVMLVYCDLDPHVAAREASWASDRVVTVVAGHRFSLGQATWMARHVASQMAIRDDDLPETVWFAVEQFLIQYQP